MLRSNQSHPQCIATVHPVCVSRDFRIGSIALAMSELLPAFSPIADVRQSGRHALNVPMSDIAGSA